MGLESLKAKRDRCKLNWWYKVNNERYPRLLLDSEWDVKPCRGTQAEKDLEERISELLLQLNLDSQETLAEDYMCTVNAFLERVDAVLRQREYRELMKA